MSRLIRLRRSLPDQGASAVEYALLVSLIAAVIVTAVFLFGGTVRGLFSQTASCVSTTTAC